MFSIGVNFRKAFNPNHPLPECELGWSGWRKRGSRAWGVGSGKVTRKLSYRKDDRAMRPIYGRIAQSSLQ